MKCGQAIKLSLPDNPRKDFYFINESRIQYLRPPRGRGNETQDRFGSRNSTAPQPRYSMPDTRTKKRLQVIMSRKNNSYQYIAFICEAVFFLYKYEVL